MQLLIPAILSCQVSSVASQLVYRILLNPDLLGVCWKSVKLKVIYNHMIEYDLEIPFTSSALFPKHPENAIKAS
jgi:hypothetical protein